MSSTYFPKGLRQRVADQGRHRCGYCLTLESIAGQPMELDHLTPQSLGGPTREENLWLACGLCNAYKGDRISAQDPESGRLVRLFNPRYQVWEEHFRWADSGARVVGKTAIGRATVFALRLNRALLVEARRLWMSAGWHPPEDP